ncbi:MAG: SDR family oxidoreductase [Candidatus Promineifilaceae bacterium]|nr:SDR family oxidoreductase [Candidatus Promineifilaceae bacterium]
MKITVFGASGSTGQEIVRQGLALGHTVTAFVRDPARLALEDPSLRMVVGDALDPAAVVRAIRGQDAVIVSLGSRERNNPRIRTTGTANVIQALEAQGRGRLVVISAAGTGDSYDQPLFFKLLVKTLLSDVYADHERQEAHVRASDLAWVIIRPAGLTDGPPTAEIETALPGVTLQGGRIRHANLARFALRQLSDDRFLRQAVSVA